MIRRLTVIRNDLTTDVKLVKFGLNKGLKGFS